MGDLLLRRRRELMYFAGFALTFAFFRILIWQQGGKNAYLEMAGIFFSMMFLVVLVCCRRGAAADAHLQQQRRQGGNGSHQFIARFLFGDEIYDRYYAPYIQAAQSPGLSEAQIASLTRVPFIKRKALLEALRAQRKEKDIHGGEKEMEKEGEVYMLFDLKPSSEEKDEVPDEKTTTRQEEIKHQPGPGMFQAFIQDSEHLPAAAEEEEGEVGMEKGRDSDDFMNMIRIEKEQDSAGEGAGEGEGESGKSVSKSQHCDSHSHGHSSQSSSCSNSLKLTSAAGKVSNNHSLCNTCTICLVEYMTEDTLVLLPCLHDYHETCIAQWLSKQASCPLCKTDIRQCFSSSLSLSPSLSVSTTLTPSLSLSTTLSSSLSPPSLSLSQSHSLSRPAPFVAMSSRSTALTFTTLSDGETEIEIERELERDLEEGTDERERDGERERGGEAVVVPVMTETPRSVNYWPIPVQGRERERDSLTSSGFDFFSYSLASPSESMRFSLSSSQPHHFLSHSSHSSSSSSSLPMSLSLSLSLSSFSLDLNERERENERESVIGSVRGQEDCESEMRIPDLV
jgi:hypothetical protein